MHVVKTFIYGLDVILIYSFRHFKNYKLIQNKKQ